MKRPEVLFVIECFDAHGRWHLLSSFVTTVRAKAEHERRQCKNDWADVRILELCPNVREDA